MAEGFIRFDRVRKVYQAGEVAVTALHDASFDIERGEICVIVGESGAGKTTLLNILGGMDSLTDGSVIVDGKEVSSFSKAEQKLVTSSRRICSAVTRTSTPATCIINVILNIIKPPKKNVCVYVVDTIKRTN